MQPQASASKVARRVGVSPAGIRQYSDARYCVQISAAVGRSVEAKCPPHKCHKRVGTPVLAQLPIRVRKHFGCVAHETIISSRCGLYEATSVSSCDRRRDATKACHERSSALVCRCNAMGHGIAITFGMVPIMRGMYDSTCGTADGRQMEGSCAVRLIRGWCKCVVASTPVGPRPWAVAYCELGDA